MKRIAVLNDLSGFGRCSLTAALPVISAMGVECCPLPTAILSNQTGYDSYYLKDCTENIEAFSAEWEKMDIHFDAILTGYLASAEQVEKIIRFLKVFRKPDTLFICDPVMADNGTLYGGFDTTLCQEVKRLTTLADVITPNLTELCILTNQEYDTISSGNIESIEHIAKSLLSNPLKTVIVTGIQKANQILNLVVTEKDAYIVPADAFDGCYSGTGDLFSSIVSAGLVKGYSAKNSVTLATEFLESAIKDSYLEGTDRNDGVNFQNYLYKLFEKDGVEL